MSRFVAVEANGELLVHLPDTSGQLATLCGIDGDDPDASVRQRIVPVKPGQKSNCKRCKAVWDVATQYRASDFEK